MSDVSELNDAAASADPAVGLRAVRALQRLQEQLEAIHVATPVTWVGAGRPSPMRWA